MSDTTDEIRTPVFEIDQQDRYGQYMLRNRREIAFHLKTLINQRSFLSLYLDAGEVFFLSNLLAVDEESNRICFDLPGETALLEATLKSRHITMSAVLDRVKIQLRLHALELDRSGKTPMLVGLFPEQMLRLQRREFFRIDTPKINPLRCKLSRKLPDGRSESFDFPLFDMSGGGLCLTGDAALSERFSQGELFADCRLEIPGETVFSVNLCVREVIRQEHARGALMRLGCEFLNLSGGQLAHLERYITRLERERKARESGLG